MHQPGTTVLGWPCGGCQAGGRAAVRQRASTTISHAACNLGSKGLQGLAGWRGGMPRRSGTGRQLPVTVAGGSVHSILLFLKSARSHLPGPPILGSLASGPTATTTRLLLPGSLLLPLLLALPPPLLLGASPVCPVAIVGGRPGSTRSRRRATLLHPAPHQRHRPAHQPHQQPGRRCAELAPQRAQYGGQQVCPLQQQAGCTKGAAGWQTQGGS